MFLRQTFGIPWDQPTQKTQARWWPPLPGYQLFAARFQNVIFELFALTRRRARRLTHSDRKDEVC